jgi:hypothetical protein
MGEKFTVYVDDNFHYMDESERYTLGEFDTEAEAIQAAKAIVDEFLESGYSSGVSAKELFDGYKMYGEDPWISGVKFSAWDYARQRCEEMCGTG